MTNLEMIQDALRLIGVLPEGQTASAEQGEDGLRAMNDLLAEWANDHIDVGHFPQTDTTEDFPGGYEVAAAVKYNLAAFMAPQFGRPIDAVIAGLAERYYRRLLRDSAIGRMQEADTSFLPGGAGGSYNILTDE